MSASDHDRTILEIQNSATQRIRVAHHWHKGRAYVDIRLVAVNSAGDFQPTQQGIFVRPDLLPQLIQALALAAREGE